MQEEAIVLLSLGSLNVTAYSLMLTGAAVLGILLTLLLSRKSLGVDRALSVCLSAIPGAIIGGHLFYTLPSLANILADYESGASLIWKLYLGGYTVYGGILGGIAGIAIYGALTHQKILPMLDAVAPASALVVCIARAAERFTNQGLGNWIEDEAMMRFPFGVSIAFDEDYIEWRVPVFFYEALAALVLLIILLVMLKRKSRVPGRLAGSALVLFSCMQIWLEQIRQDDYIRFGFVRFSQIMAIAVIVAIMVIRTIGTKRKGGWSTSLTIRWAIILISAGIIILVEFALEKPQVMPFLRIALLVEAAVISCGLINIAARKNRKDTKNLHFITMGLLSLLVVGIAVTSVYLLTLELEWENTLLMGLMAAALVAIAHTLQLPFVPKTEE